MGALDTAPARDSHRQMCVISSRVIPCRGKVAIVGLEVSTSMRFGRRPKTTGSSWGAILVCCKGQMRSVLRQSRRDEQKDDMQASLMLREAEQYPV